MDRVISGITLFLIMLALATGGFVMGHLVNSRAGQMAAQVECEVTKP